MIFNENLVVYRIPFKKKLIGIYFLLENDNVVYVGQSKNIQDRISSHRNRYAFNGYAFIICKEEELDTLEDFYIMKYQPKYNKRHNIAKRIMLITSYKNLKQDIRKKLSIDRYSEIMHKYYRIRKYNGYETIYLEDSKEGNSKIESGIYEL